MFLIRWLRFRVLNGDPRKSFNIGFSTNIDTSDHASRLTFYQIATDGGYMGKAHPMQAFLINPGERGEFLVDFTGMADRTEVFLSNLSSDPKYAGPKDIVGLGGDKEECGSAESRLCDGEVCGEYEFFPSQSHYYDCSGLFIPRIPTVALHALQKAHQRATGFFWAFAREAKVVCGPLMVRLWT